MTVFFAFFRLATVSVGIAMEAEGDGVQNQLSVEERDQVTVRINGRNPGPTPLFLQYCQIVSLSQESSLRISGEGHHRLYLLAAFEYIYFTEGKEK